MDKIAANKLALAFARELIETNEQIALNRNNAEALITFIRYLSEEFEKSQSLDMVNTQMVFHLFGRKNDR